MDHTKAGRAAGSVTSRDVCSTAPDHGQAAAEQRRHEAAGICGVELSLAAKPTAPLRDGVTKLRSPRLSVRGGG